MKIIKGDLVKAVLNPSEDGASVMMHVCNNKGVMGSGIALQVRNKIPAAYRAYKEFESQYGGIPLGSISVCSNVINLHSQDGYGQGFRHLNYEALYISLESARDYLKSHGKVKLGIPYRMGSDRAGGDWNIVCAMVDSLFKNDEGFSLYVYDIS